MPKRTDIASILLVGSGPIVIGQACEFDYSGTQAIKALREEGYRVILVNSNPATIMTDPDIADRTYIEPITAECVEKIIERERPDAILPTMGGQTALNTALELHERGVFERYNCELIGATIESIAMAEDRALFRTAMEEIGLRSAQSALVRSLHEAREFAETQGYPLILRPSRTLGGTGGGIVREAGELEDKVRSALMASPNHEVLIEQSLLGWKEIELEVMRDLKDNCVIVCGIENLDPMGVHTGDSITVAPIQTLTDKEYQDLRDASLKVMRKIGVDTGGSNVQFAVNPATGESIIIEMNPRVSRSSALASKATGFPIAKIAAKLAVGYTLDEISNDITRETPACFEPAIDYTVVKFPRFAFEKFPNTDRTLGTQMKSVGEVLAFGRSFSEAFQKALCSLELGYSGFCFDTRSEGLAKEALLTTIQTPTDTRILWLAEALRRGATLQEVHVATGIDTWFLGEIEAIIHSEEALRSHGTLPGDTETLFALKRAGFSDQRLAELTGTTAEEVRLLRRSKGIRPSFYSVDTCAGEFEAFTPYLYSTYERDVPEPREKGEQANRRIVILGSGPNRIGQGIEFDYCCVHAVMALRELGIESIMVNCNPETVSTDYDVSDRLYFEPLSYESVVEILEHEKPEGVIVQLGGQTPLKLARELRDFGIPVLGTSVESIEAAEDREIFADLVSRLKLQQPQSATARSLPEAVGKAHHIGYPLMVRPSFVLGGRAMRVVYSEEELSQYFQESIEVSEDRPVLIDRFLENATEVDLDCVSDGQQVIVAGVMEHIERAGIHSGDSSCCLPPQSLSAETIAVMKQQAERVAQALDVCGLMNMQFAVTRDDEVFVLEVNPRASRTIPFVSKANGVPWAKVAARVMSGQLLSQIPEAREREMPYTAVKACVFPFQKFQGVDTLLGPEMKSTGEVMGVDANFPLAFSKAMLASSVFLPRKGRVFLSIPDADKNEAIGIADILSRLGMELTATRGTALFLRDQGFEVRMVNKVREGSPHIVDMIRHREIDLIVNTPEGHGPFLDSRSIRLVAGEERIPTFTTIAAAHAAARAIEFLCREQDDLGVRSIQEYHSLLGKRMEQNTPRQVASSVESLRVGE